MYRPDANSNTYGQMHKYLYMEMRTYFSSLLWYIKAKMKLWTMAQREEFQVNVSLN